MTIRITRKTARLLDTLLVIHKMRRLAREATGGNYHMPSYEIMRRSNIGPGSFYPIMERLEASGWVESEWETVAQGHNRPRRLFYRLTEDGVTWARTAVKKDARRITLWDRIMKGLMK